MLPRTTQQSHRPRVSDRTMVDTMLLECLSHGGTNAEQMQRNLEVPTDANHAPAKRTGALNRRGLDARELRTPCGRRSVFS
jgi:hypothetical protein